jgi:hypothetical protein
MKKLICIISTLLFLAGTLVSCANETTTVTTATTATTAPQISAEQIKAQGFFTGTVKSISNETTLEVDVDDTYFEELGKTVIVSIKKAMSIKSGDKIRICFENIVKNETITSTNVQITQTVDNRDIISDDLMKKYGVTPVEDLRVPKNLQEIASTEGLTESVGGNIFSRVAKIENGNVYLSDIYAQNATVAIIGIPDYSFTVGDYVRIKCNNVYGSSKAFYTLINAEDITELHIESKEAIEQIMYEDYMWDPSMDKPVIYLYPEEEIKVSVKVNIDGKLTCTYPEHGEEGWQNFTAKPDGTLVSPDGREYYCLYWEGRGNMTPDFSRGFCVKGEDTAEFLADVLPKIGLTPREANEFIIYWLPILQKNEYNLISFQNEAYTSAAELEITPTPDSLLRVFMAAKPLDAPVEIAPQEFTGFERNGFTVVEWGGGIIE